MPRLLIFDKLPAGSHTYFDHIETGAQVPVYPGDAFPAHLVADPEHYVKQGMAHLEGVEDGSDGRLARLLKLMRGAFKMVAPLEGAASTWSLDAMIAKAKELEAADAAAIAAFEAAPPITIDEIHEADAATS